MNFRPCVTGVGVQVEQNWCKNRALRKAVTFGSPRTGVIAHVHPETSISKQQTHQSGEPIWHAFTQFVKKTSVPDSVICCCKSRKTAPVFRFCWNPFSMKVARAATWSQVLRPFRKSAWSGLSKPSTVGEMRWSARRRTGHASQTIVVCPLLSMKGRKACTLLRSMALLWLYLVT